MLFRSRVLKERSFWDIAENQNASWSWKKLLRLRPMAQRFVEINDGREVKINLERKYKVVVVWGKIKKKKEKVTW